MLPVMLYTDNINTNSDECSTNIYNTNMRIQMYGMHCDAAVMPGETPIFLYYLLGNVIIFLLLS